MTPCEGCIHRSRLWGMDYCLLASWFGKDNEKICSEYKRR